MKNSKLDSDLFEAVYQGNLNWVKQLILKGADLEAENENGSTPLIQASAVGNLKMIQFMLKLGSNIEHKNNAQQTCLIAAITLKRYQAVKLLISLGADQNYALQHFNATQDLLCIKILSEMCSYEFKLPYLYLAKGRDENRLSIEETKAISEFLNMLIAVPTFEEKEFSNNNETSIESGVLLRFLEKLSFDSIGFLRVFVERYPFFELPHILIGELLIEKGGSSNIEEALFYLEIAYSLNQLNLKTHYLLSLAQQIFGQNHNMEIAGLKERFCYRPFERFISNIDGNAYLCCPSWLPISIGSFYKLEWEELWNSETAEEIRRSVLDGDFRYCSRLLCPKIQNGSLPMKKDIDEDYYSELISKKKYVNAAPPVEYVLGHDQSCNFACPSCRKEKYIINDEEEERLENLIQQLVLPILKEVNRMILSGSGEFITSKHCIDILEMIEKNGYSELELVLLTNGVLFNENVWDKFSEIHNKIREVHVSVDAVNAETYSLLSKGGSFKRLIGNLKLFSNLKKLKKIDCLRMNMVVQQKNYKEMKEFVLMGKKLGCDLVVFSRITNWGCSTPDEFRKIDVASPSHPEYENFLSLLKDPIFNDKIVDLYNLYTCWKKAIHVSKN